MRPDMPLSGHSSRLLLDGAGSIAGGRDWDKVGGIVDNHCREDHPDQFRGHGAVRAALLYDGPSGSTTSPPGGPTSSPSWNPS